MNKTIRYAVFDMDGTLVHSLFYWEEKWREVGEKYLSGKNDTVPEEIDHAVRTMKLDECAIYVKNKLHLDVSDEEIVSFFADGEYDFYRTRASVKDGARELLSFLAQNGIRMAIATATEGETAKFALGHFGLLSCFDAVVSCADPDVNAGKDSPKVYEKALRLLGADPRETLLFEDSDLALATAKKMGFITVGIEDPYNHNFDRLRENADFVISQGENLCDAFRKACLF